MSNKLILLLVLLFALAGVISPQIFHRNKGESLSIGSYNKGSMKNGYLLPVKGENFKCYSKFSYYVLGREYINSKACKAILATYNELNSKYPDRQFIYMESAQKKGGRLYPHRTHQNGLSIDFMSPLVKKGDPKYFNLIGIYRYALNFNDDGQLRLNSDIKIDFNIMAEHILLLEKNARKNGLKIKKVILKIDLKDNLFQTEYGKKLKSSGIYFAQNLTPTLNKLHDDHYHVDFEIIENRSND